MTTIDIKDVPNTIVEISVNIYPCDRDVSGIKDVPIINTISEDQATFNDKTFSNYEEAQPSGLVEGMLGGMLAHTLTTPPVSPETISNTTDIDSVLPCSFEAPIMTGSEVCSTTSSHNEICTLSDPSSFNSIYSDLDSTLALSINNPNYLSYHESDFSSSHNNDEEDMGGQSEG